ncbi:MAG: RidA family protein [Herbaspirillum sp.]|nr:RidA family protein [Herbaspirillum sp.]
MSAEKRIRELGIKLTQASAPAANYKNASRWGNTVYLAGKGPSPENGAFPQGKLGREYTVEQGRHFARTAALELISALRDELGSLDEVAQIVELQGFVNAMEDFKDHAAVLDGASNLFVEIFGELGVHARSVLGANSLRGGCP